MSLTAEQQRFADFHLGSSHVILSDAHNIVCANQSTVLRFGSAALLHEERLAPLIPSAANYPGITAAGELDDNSRWMAMPYVPGHTVSDHWADMPLGERQAFLASARGTLDAIHAATADDPYDLWRAVPKDRPREWGEGQFVGISLSIFGQLLGRLASLRVIGDKEQSAIRSRYHALREAAGIPNTVERLSQMPEHTRLHGDPTLDNWLVNEHGDLVALDYECAGAGPAGIDRFMLLHSIDTHDPTALDDPQLHAAIANFLHVEDKTSEQTFALMSLLQLMRTVFIKCHWSWAGNAHHDAGWYAELRQTIQDEIGGTGMFERLTAASKAP